MNSYRARRRLQVAAVLTVATTLLLAGCGSDDKKNDATGTASTESPTPSASASPSAAPTDTSTLPSGVDTLSPITDSSITDKTGVTPREEVFNVQSPWNTPVLNARIAANSQSLLANSR